ncbi:MAG: TIGR04282 family arsenosugar biosynthesis glycosyltransferase [Mycobacteriales bacterium]
MRAERLRADPRIEVQVLVLAKAPVPGRVKTRLCPPLTPDGAARVAAAALEDTLDTVRAVALARRVLVLDGSWDAAGFQIQPQRGGPMPDRLAAAFDDCGDLPALLVGMDTPQLTPALLQQAVDAFRRYDAVLGLAPDGGWWALGLRRPDGDLLRDIATSQADTGARQLDRLRDAGLDPYLLPELRDVDTADDARAVAALAPAGRFAAVVRELLP